MMLNLTPEQIAILQQIRAVEMAKKLDIRYDTIEEDERNRRRSIFLDGGLDMLVYILNFDAAAAAEKEAEKQALLATATAQEQNSGQPFTF